MKVCFRGYRQAGDINSSFRDVMMTQSRQRYWFKHEKAARAHFGFQKKCTKTMDNEFDQPDNSHECYGARIAYGKRPVPMTPSRAAKLKVH